MKDSLISLINRLRAYYVGISVPVKASLWFAICSAMQKGIDLLCTPIFTRILSPEEYGVYAVYQSWYPIFLIFTTLNLYAGVYNNGMIKWPKDRAALTSSLLGLSTTVTIIWLVIYLFNVNYWNNLIGLPTILVLAIFAEALFVPAYNFWATSQRFDYKYKNLVIVTLSMGIITPILGITAVLFTPYKAESRILSIVLVQVCVGLIFYIKKMYAGHKFYIKKYWLFALAFNLPLVPHYLSQTILNQIDLIMIADIVGTREAAIYAVAYTISMMLTIITTAINASYIPFTYKAIKNHDYQALRETSGYLVLFIGIGSILAICVGPEIIRIFAAPVYYESRWIIPPVAEAVLFMFIFPLFCNIEFYFEQTKFIMVASLMAAVTNIALNYVTIPKFGYIAAAYTTLLCYMLLTAAHYVAYKFVCKRRGINIELYNIKLILLVIFISLIMMLIIVFMYDNWKIRYTIILSTICILYYKHKFVLDKINIIKV